MKEILDSEKELVNHKELAEYFFKENQLQAKIAKAHGKRACKYSPLVLRFCMHLKAKLGAGNYEFVAKVFNIAYPQTLRNYEGADHTEKDGVMWKIILIMARNRDEYYGNKGEMLGDKLDF
eukprot:8149460-Ditylum_brightwellii.AAC.2